MATPPENSEEIARLSERCRSAADMLEGYNQQQRQAAQDIFHMLSAVFEFSNHGPRRPMFSFKPCGTTNEECLAELHEKLPAGVTPAMMAQGKRYA